MCSVLYSCGVSFFYLARKHLGSLFRLAGAVHVDRDWRFQQGLSALQRSPQNIILESHHPCVTYATPHSSARAQFSDAYAAIVGFSG